MSDERDESEREPTPDELHGRFLQRVFGGPPLTLREASEWECVRKKLGLPRDVVTSGRR